MAYTDNAAQGILESNVKSDRELYDRQFAAGAVQLRNIALGMDEGNQYEMSNKAGAQSGRLFASASGQYDRDLARRGMATDDPLVQGQRKRLGLSRIIAQVDAQNGAARAAKSNQKAAQSFGVQSFGDLTIDSNNILGNIARSEVERYAQWKGANASGSASAAGLAGAAASFI